MADLSAVWTNVPECHFLCELTEGAVGKLEYHYLAVVIYLTAIAVVAMSVLKKDYFKTNYTNKLKRHGINIEGVNTVWWFSAAIVTFNALLHAAQLFEIGLDRAPIKALGSPGFGLCGVRATLCFGYGLLADIGRMPPRLMGLKRKRPY